MLKLRYLFTFYGDLKLRVCRTFHQSNHTVILSIDKVQYFLYGPCCPFSPILQEWQLLLYLDTLYYLSLSFGPSQPDFFICIFQSSITLAINTQLFNAENNTFITSLKIQ